MKKNIVLAVIATAAMALSLVGCGVKVTNISVPDAATLEKGESITLPVNFGTEDAPAETPVIATGESATAETAAQDEKIAKAAEKLTLAWTSSDESVATVHETGTVTAVAAGEAEITAAVKDTEMQDVCVITVKVSGTFNSFADTLTVMTQTSCISVSLTVAVISASPAATAVTVPVSSTVATLSSEEVHASVSFSAALAIFSSCAAVSAVADSPVAITGVSAGVSSVPKFTGSVMLSPFSRVAVSGTEMFVTLTPHPTRLSAIAAVAITANTIFFFIKTLLLGI